MTGLVLRGAADDVEFHRATELMAAAYRQRPAHHVAWVATHAAAYPAFRREHARVAYHHGALAGALRVTTETIQIGEARLRMGGLGWVTTAPEHRHKGIARELIRHTMAYLRDRQYHVSMLFGLPNFYRRFGFVSVVQDHALRIDTLDALRIGLPPALRVRPAKPGDIPAMLRLHAASEGCIACAIVRTRAHLTNRWPRWAPARVIIDPQGHPRAYVLPRPAADALEIDEIGCAEAPLYPALVRACADLAHEAGLPWVRFYLPPAHPIAPFLAAQGARESVLPRGVADGMLAVLNADETLESMIPEWEQRLVAAGARDLSAELTLLIDGRPCRIRVHRGAIDCAAAYGRNKVSLGVEDLAALLAGLRSGEEELSGRHVAVAPEARTLAALLLPRRNPYVWPQDRF